MSKELTIDFCLRLVPNFTKLVCELQKLHPEWSVQYLAGNLMEFGRGQTSGIVEPNEKDLAFYKSYLAALNFDQAQSALFSAYATGCLMGLVQNGELTPAQFIESVEISRQFAENCMDT